MGALTGRRPLLGLGVTLAATLAVTLAGCAGALPPVAPPFEARNLALRIDADRELPVRVLFPARGRALPVVLFSHGAYSSKDDYDAILGHWAAHGYVVVAPTHRDSTRLGTKRGSPEPRFFAWRLDDMQALSARLDELLAQVPELAGRVDTSRVAATGHSFGGLVAQTLGGASFQDLAGGGATLSRRDSRVRAVIIFSGAGSMEPLLRPQNFAALTLPTLVTVGSEDLAQAPGLTGYAWRRQPFDLIAPGNKFLLTLEGADHYLGGAVGRDDLPRAANAPRYVAAFNATSLRFLDAFLRGDRRAARRIAETDEPLARIDVR